MIKFFTGKQLYSQTSKFNGEIKVIDQYGTRKVIAGGLLQSGSIIKQLWQKPLKHITIKPKHILLLGLGGGTVVKQLRKKFPNSIITAIEIDPVMITISQKYFNIKSSKKLLVKEADAFRFIKQDTQTYDLILVDLFASDSHPTQFFTKTFHHHLKTRLNTNGQVIFNCLFFDHHKHNTEKFISEIEKYFLNVQLVRSLSNIFIITKD